MPWTTPRTWVPGEIVTAALLNTHARDNQKTLSDAWTAYTPVWTAATTNPTLGNGTLTGNYMQVGKWVRFRIDMVIGTTTNGGTGSWFWTVPAAVAAIGPVGTVACSNGAGGTYPRIAFSVNATAIAAADMVPNRVGPGVPFAWGSATELHINGQYEAA